MNTEPALATTAMSQPPGRDGEAEIVILSPWQLAWRRFRKHKMALIALGGLILILIYIWFG